VNSFEARRSVKRHAGRHRALDRRRDARLEVIQ
jgi:hypothetical protein